MESILPSEKIIQTVCSGAPVPRVEDLEHQFSPELELLRKETLFPRPEAINNLLLSLNTEGRIS